MSAVENLRGLRAAMSESARLDMWAAIWTMISVVLAALATVFGALG